MTNRVPFSFIVVIGLMLFALFFGAGNLIFPAMLGQSAGTNVWSANAGFLVTGVGLPLLGVLAFGISGKEDLQSLASRVHPIFGLVFTTVLYLAIGPLFAIPRTGNVSFEIGVKPFLSENPGSMPLIIFTIIFFSITCFFSLNPAKIVDIVGKILTPIKLTFIGILVLVAFIHPIGDMQAPVEAYTSNAFFKGFQEGYLTMDTLASFVFGIIIINAIKEKGAKTKKQIMVVCAKATIIAATVLAIIYSALSYMGASSVAKLGHLENGGEVLAKVSNYYFGSYGGILLGLMITVACLTTSVGLVSACSSFFHKLFPKVSYKKIAIMLSVFSAIVANVGLTQLIAISVPVLTAIYPLAIVLIFLTFLHPLFKGRTEVYQVSLLVTFIISLFDGLGAAGVNIQAVNQLFTRILPMHEVGLGWIFPAIIGGFIGYGISYFRMKNEIHSSAARLNK
ncbi:branched-chain amino acid transport system II carrier protein [Bacillus pseudomycoides]|uniref:Branched-chain amino acid transport system carrier protein n=1 Tax=Bacillus pseudomycoides TaxID=64104 RepID=A0AA91V9V0_9BACI|nr:MULTISPECIES: branched-chain amino acid transport system II carrier protein [Bacillus]PEB50578.1 branched-chain amino acid transport system II carrier protein [Bacillus sp. AFS098217]PED81242.1 branched-chain amino acid transport system II carrier protein [Bacillus pseudomycoides]PEU07064.1 branched-chain amino acid transport system II carrier protein [Bacillus sp. AFS019443]PEU15182.1 branched-chain amino acid transport system II carrier protein [Bacillus sp. AFS014408]PFW59570.1 branched-